METKIPKNLYRFGFRGYTDQPADLDLKAIEKIRKYIRQNYSQIKNLNTRHTSYFYKHKVEQALGHYVANGDLIAAMILEGFRYKQDYTGSVNCWFNVSTRGKKIVFRPPIKNRYNVNSIIKQRLEAIEIAIELCSSPDKGDFEQRYEAMKTLRASTVEDTDLEAAKREVSLLLEIVLTLRGETREHLARRAYSVFRNVPDEFKKLIPDNLKHFFHGN